MSQKRRLLLSEPSSIAYTGRTYNLKAHRMISERREHKVFLLLLKSIPGLEGRIMSSSEEEVHIIATLVRLSY